MRLLTTTALSSALFRYYLYIPVNYLFLCIMSIIKVYDILSMIVTVTVDGSPTDTPFIEGSAVIVRLKSSFDSSTPSVRIRM